MKIIRVAQILYTYDVETAGGGLSLYITELGAKLDPKRFDRRLCGLGYYDSPRARKRMAELEAGGCNTFIATQWDAKHPYKSILRACYSLYKHFSKEPIDILHSHLEYTDIVALILKLSGKAPCIIRTVHTGSRHEWVVRPMIRALLPNFLYVFFYNLEVGINQEKVNILDQRWMARLFKKHAKKIYNALSSERISKIQQYAALPKNHPDTIALKISLGIPSESPVIGSVGRLAEQKGYCYLIKAAEILHTQLPDAYYVIVGDGDLQYELEQQAEQAGIREQVIFTGARTDVDKLLHCMDIFVSSSLWEGLPSVIMEAMAGQIPVIATDIPGTMELVQHNQNGLLVPPADAEHLAKAILRVLKSPEITQRLVDAGLATLPKFSLDQAVQQYEELYTQLAASQSRH